MHCDATWARLVFFSVNEVAGFARGWEHDILFSLVGCYEFLRVGGGRDEGQEGGWGSRGGAGVEAWAVVIGRHGFGEGAREGPFADESDTFGSVADVLYGS